MKAVVFTLGCKVNECESDGIITALKNVGYEVSDKLVKADLYIVNTCAVTLEAEKKSRQMASRIYKLNPKAKIIKFSSPMCSECKDMEIELNKAMSDYKDSVLIEEINVIEKGGKTGSYNKTAIKKFDVTLVPTIVILDKEGKVIKRNEGLMKSDEIIEILAGIK